MMKKMIAALMAMTVAMAMLAGCNSGSDNGGDSGNSGDSGKTYKWKLAHISNEDHYWHTISLEFADRIKEATDGQIEITVYPNQQLGPEVDVLNGILQGTCDMTISGESMSGWAPLADLMAAPYAYQDEEHVKKVINGAPGEKIKEQLIGAGFRPMFYTLRSPRELTSNKPISTPAELQNTKMRLSNSPLHIACWNAAGAQTSVMGLSECYTALSQNVVEAQENPYDLIYSSGFYDVQKYVNETDHVYSYIFFILGQKQYDSLSDELKTTVDQVCTDIQPFADETYYAQKETSKQQCIDKGMIINDQVDKEAFAAAMQPAIKEYFDEDVYAVYEEIVALGEQA